ncbi:MMPL family transporter [Planomonospora sp. ID91781]|uniref:MMPL family transporter n=1 Tax=Planomonospora sp. ID91781 TaxID=2738135 RepID=UPI0018C44F14|nr:MMPL family transporter [Planomonospora sp. ID91781]MBG0824135.1 MMPL family transporter [Planomonospora sp. ID91781]
MTLPAERLGTGPAPPRPPEGPPGPAGRLGTWAARHRRPVAGVWLLAVVVSLALLPGLVRTLGGPSLEVAGSPSARAAALLERGFPEMGSEQVVAAFTSTAPTAPTGPAAPTRPSAPTGPAAPTTPATPTAPTTPTGPAASDPAYLRAVGAALRALAGRPGVGAVQVLPPAPGQDRRNLYALVGLTGDEAARQRRLADQASVLREAAGRASGGTVGASLVGVTPLFAEVKEVDLADLRTAEAVAVPLALLILTAGLGSLGAALVPLVVAGAAVAVTAGVLAAAGPGLGAGPDTLTLTVACSVALGLGMDYALLITFRYRQARGRGLDRFAAAGTATATAGTTVCWCAVAVALAACALLAVRVGPVRSLALPAVVAAVAAPAGALTLLPALLAGCDRFLAFGALPRRGGSGRATGRHGVAREGEEGGWARWARHLMRHPWPYLAGATALLLLAAAPLPGLRLGMDVDRASVAGTDAGRGLARMEADGVAGLTALLLPHPPGAPPVDTSALVAALRADPRVALAVPADNGRDLTVVVVLSDQPPDRAGAAALNERIARAPALGLLPAGQRVLVGGPAAMTADLGAASTDRLWQVAALVLSGSLLFLSVAFRSLLLPLKAVLLNLLTVAAAFGLTVWVFQGPSGTPAVSAVLPVALLTLVFGLSMDYEVFVVHRIAEYRRAGAGDTAAVALGLQHSARTVTLAAAVMVVTFAGLLAGHRQEVRQLGFAVAAAITIDAVLIRLVMVPALMRLLGRGSWWLPAPLARLLPPAGPGVAVGPEPSVRSLRVGP